MNTNHSFRTLTTLAALLLSAGLAQGAESQMKPGLWEHKIEFTSESGEMEKMMAQLRQQMENMPAEQRQMMEKMMKSRGVNFDFKSQAFKTCLTPEQAAQGNLKLMENNHCEETSRDTSGDSTTIHFTCSGDTDADGSITFDGDKHYSGESNATVEFQGRPEKMTIAHQGEWQISDCGEIKPH